MYTSTNDYSIKNLDYQIYAINNQFNSSHQNKDTGDNIVKTSAKEAIIEEKADLQITISDKLMQESFKKLNRKLLGTSRKVEYSLNNETKELIVTIVDIDTNEVVKQFPTNKKYEIADIPHRMSGLLMDKLVG